ncbi:MAG: hypothetical protein GSR86_03020 [Desulfurococcales archaeon]|nr:hypothetical protein [Desulfurococcales archaeon]
MVNVKGSRYYACGECGLIYEDRALAEACEEWCREHRTCNRDIASRSIGYIRSPGLRL